MTVITISRQYGSGGDEIADQLCQMLGYQHFDKRMIARAAMEAGLSENEIAGYTEYSEENYKVIKFFDRLFRRTGHTSTSTNTKEDAVGVLLAEENFFNESSAITLVQKAIKVAYKSDNIIIIGRGGQVILRDYPNVLHVRIEAPLEDRIRRVEGRIKGERQDNTTNYGLWLKAKDLIMEKDASSADYVRLFYSENWADLALYHVILNTGKISIQNCSKVIFDMVQRLFT
jgi:cytidylate kinase